MYRQPMTSSVPGRSTVNVKPVRSAKSRACRSKSRRLASSDIPSTSGHPPDSKPGVARMCARLDVHAAWSDSLCSAPSGTRWNSGSSSSRGGSNSSGTKGLALTAREGTADQERRCRHTSSVCSGHVRAHASDASLTEKINAIWADNLKVLRRAADPCRAARRTRYGRVDGMNTDLHGQASRPSDQVATKPGEVQGNGSVVARERARGGVRRCLVRDPEG